ncbi:MAG TPA: hypothetical protein VKY40_06130, partial [Halanaerobiales bacterium]|nr:hypothetical protein [Halanaerobiales bacterium]
MKRYLAKISLVLLVLLLLAIPATAVEEEFTYTVDLQKSYQEMEGFGGSIAWYENFLTAHPNKEELYDIIFKDLGLDILRFQNWYGKRTQVAQYEEEIVREAERSLGHPLKILITSWTPLKRLKSNDNLEDGGTLIKENGEYAYDEFASYWHNSLLAYERAGIKADYISIQNEPDYEADWN